MASKSAGANGMVIYPDKFFSFRLHLAGQRQFLHDHPAAMQKLLRALLRAEHLVEEEPQATRSIIAKYAKYDPASFDRLWPNYDLHLNLSQALLNTLEDQARWAIANDLADTKDMPNFLDVINPDAMLAVKPAAVSIVR